MKLCRFIKQTVFCLLFLTLSQGWFIAQAASNVPETLDEIVLRNWPLWSSSLTADVTITQLQTALGKRTIRGENAALLASLVEKLQQEQNNAPVTLNTVRQWVQKDPQLQYRSLKRMLFSRDSERPFLANNKPHFQALEISQQGNGAILSAIGCLAYNRPQEIKSALHRISAEQYSVHFPSGQKAGGSIPTEGELLAHKLVLTLKDGTWAVLLYNTFEQQLGKTATPDSVQTLWSGAPPKLYNLAPSDLSQLRTVLKNAVNSKRIIQAVLGEKPDNPVPGLEYGQTYAVLRFDDTNDEVTLWHPHAQSFEPADSEEAATAGYLITAGVLQLPLTDFVAIFPNLVVESK